MGALGPTHIDVLHYLARSGETATASNYVRKHHTGIALLASLGLITSLSREGRPTRMWRLTIIGHNVIEME